MKKVIYLLVLCMVLGMAGCGTNQENKRTCVWKCVRRNRE